MAIIGTTPAGDAPNQKHEGFLRYAGYRWVKIAVAIVLLVIAYYAFHEPEPQPNGGTAYGYFLGTVGALLILWLTAIGIRKRAMTRGRWSLKAWTSAHVYLGLALIVIGTLHTGFQFGWNVHTLAYALMLLVIASGIFGISAYATLPQALSDNRSEMTEAEMIDALRALDRQLLEAAQPLSQASADRVDEALAEDPLAAGMIRRLFRFYPKGPTERAIEPLRGDGRFQRIEGLLEQRISMIARIRRHMWLRGMLEVWLYVHVPATIALLAALTAHIVAVFFYW